MVTEALETGLITKPKATELTSEKVKGLRRYWVQTEHVLSLNLLFIPLELSLLSPANSERQTSGLLTNDSVLVSGMRSLGIAALATNDSGFDFVSGINVFRPEDVRPPV
jgi:predicted nucleic acid-binding protein